ncbi:MAG TPA: GDSL-type esterase/lipase family protein [Phycisphaerae bacterium]|nr:GDSL-type esterase/lipase family protein [Phycisphaerae bacterium]
MRRSILAIPVLLSAALFSCTQAIDPNSPLNESAYHPPIKVACVGDSITLGYGLGDNTYPEQLQRLLGDKYEVRNFGVSGATLLAHGDKPYIQQDFYKQSLDFHPDVVVIMLGTNDSKPVNWQYREEFASDYSHLVGSYQHLEPKPRVWLAYPCPVIGQGKYNIRESPVDMEQPLIKKVANAHSAGIIDVHGALLNHPEDFPDTVHPNAQGAGIMARTVYHSLTGNSYKGPLPIGASATAP